VADNYTKLALQQSLAAAATVRARAEIERTGRALPCKVSALNPNGMGYAFVEVTFELQNTLLPPLILPKAESQWLRAPTQIGDFGITMPADSYTGGISGLGGVADLSVDYGNMSTLLWVPCGSSAFAAAADPNKAWVNGPAGALLSDAAQTASVTVAENMVTIAAGGSSGLLITATASALTINVGGKTWTFASAGFTDDSGIVLDTHIHGGVETGTGTSGPPVV
jgi:hypothetical protein